MTHEWWMVPSTPGKEQQQPTKEQNKGIPTAPVGMMQEGAKLTKLAYVAVSGTGLQWDVKVDVPAHAWEIIL
jgi:hypothetical protein